MRFSYETGKATLIQFIVLGILNIINTIYSIVTTCNNPNGQCASNVLSSVVFYILIMIWFGIILFIGFQAQDKRSKRYAQLLILAELAVFLFAGYNIKLGIASHEAIINFVTSFVDLVLALWVITLAYRLMRSGGGRIKTKRLRSDHDNL